MEFVCPGLQIECDDATAGDAALSVNPAGLRLQFLHRFHTRPDFHRVALYS